MKRSVLAVVPLFLWVLHLTAQDFRLFGEIGQKDADVSPGCCYLVQYAGRLLSDRNITDRSFLDSLLYMRTCEGIPVTMEEIRKNGSLVPNPYVEEVVGVHDAPERLLAACAGYDELLEGGGGGSFFALFMPAAPYFYYFVLDGGGELYGIDVEESGDYRILKGDEIAAAMGMEEKNKRFVRLFGRSWPIGFNIYPSCYTQAELWELLSVRFKDKALYVKHKDKVWFVHEMLPGECSFWLMAYKYDVGEGLGYSFSDVELRTARNNFSIFVADSSYVPSWSRFLSKEPDVLKRMLRKLEPCSRERRVDSK